MCFQKSDMCKYVLQGLKLINLVEMLATADCDGNWKLHVAVVEELMPVFLEFDRTNYLRHASWYLEPSKPLEGENPYLYETFMQGHFVVKDKQGKFNSASTDMKLEQTIQKASKDPGGIIGEQRNETYVAEWSLVFHETHLIADLFQNLTRSKIRDGQDTNINHKLIGTSKSKNFNEMVQSAVKVISCQGNIFTLQRSVSWFRNFLTQQNFPTDVSQKILNWYKVFHREQFVEKSKTLSEVMHKVKLPPLTNKFIIIDITCEKLKQKEKNCLKEIAASQRKTNIAKGKGGELRDILKYDVVESNMLYDGDVIDKHEQSKIIGEIQCLLPEQSILHDLGGTKMGNTCIIIDFMVVVRSIQKQFSVITFKDLLHNVIYNAKRVSSPTMIHFVFDSYIELTVKDSERLKRGLHVMYELADIYHGTIIRTGITCKKIPCYMRDSTCRWFIIKKAKIF